MKLVLSLVLFALSFNAKANTSAQVESMVADAVMQAQLLDQSANFNLIDWKVGDKAVFKVTMASLPIPLMTMNKSVTQDTGAELWVVTETTGLQSMKMEMLIRKSDAKVIKVLQNGKEIEAPSADDVEIISQEADTVTVPAGTFKTLKIVIKEKKNNVDATVWINPSELPMEGMAKQSMKVQGMDVDVSLESFTKQ